MESGNKVPTLPAIRSQIKLPKKASKAKKRLSAIDLFKLNVLKALEHSDSGSERDYDEINAKTKELPPGENISEHDKLKESKFLKPPKQINRRNTVKQSTKPICSNKTRIKRNKIKLNGRTLLPERNNEHFESRAERTPSQITDYIMEVATMVSEVTISDVERESKNKTRKKERLAPELSSPDLRRPSSAFRKKSNKTVHKQTYKKAEKTKEEIKDRPLVDLQKYLQKMAECSQNSMGRTKIKPSLYVGRNITRKSEIGKKSLPAGLNVSQETIFNQSALSNQVSTVIPTGMNLSNDQLIYNENPVAPKSSLKVKHSNTPDIKIIPPSDENIHEKSFHKAEDESSPNGLSGLLDKYPSEIPNSAKETWNTYIKLQQQGFPVTLKILQRGLMTPTDQRVLKELFIQSQKRKRLR